LQGSVGAGTGATVGFKGDKQRLMKGGIGTACAVSGRLRVGALVAVNCLGDVIDPETGSPLAGMYDRDTGQFIGAADRLIRDPEKIDQHFLRNTTIGVVATNARLTKSEAKRVAIMAHDGYAKTIYPCHTTGDGDTLFCMATGELDAVLDAVGVLAVEAVSQAVINGVLHARSVDGIPAYGDIS
jgi:L-aminopeptidase/D-esterase-like protein